EEVPLIDSYENKVLTMFSTEILNGKRKNELILLKMLLENGRVNYNIYLEKLKEANCRADADTLHSVHSIYDLSFFKQTDQKKYGDLPIIYLNGENVYCFNNKLQESLKCNAHFKYLLYDILSSAFTKREKYRSDKPLTLYESSTMYGYKPKHNTCPIFVTYHKDDDVETSVDYEDEFLSPEIFKWYTRSNRTIKSGEVQKIIRAEKEARDIHIFVKKDDDEGS